MKWVVQKKIDTALKCVWARFLSYFVSFRLNVLISYLSSFFSNTQNLKHREKNVPPLETAIKKEESKKKNISTFNWFQFYDFWFWFSCVCFSPLCSMIFVSVSVQKVRCTLECIIYPISSAMWVIPNWWFEKGRQILFSQCVCMLSGTKKKKHRTTAAND